MKAPSAVKPTKLPFETSTVAEEKCDDAMSPEPLDELLVTDRDEYHGDISPAALDVDGDVAATPSAGAGSEKLCCSYKKCNNQLLSKKQMLALCRAVKKIHPTCFHHYLRQNSFDFELEKMCFAVQRRLVAQSLESAQF
jgi:hypothetical protein